MNEIPKENYIQGDRHWKEMAENNYSGETKQVWQDGKIVLFKRELKEKPTIIEEKRPIVEKVLITKIDLGVFSSGQGRNSVL